MANVTFRKAERRKAKLRLGLAGPAGSGKTFSALLIAQGLGGKIAMIDTEHHSGELYADLCDYDTTVIEPPFLPEKYTDAIKVAEASGYDVIIIDSLSHAWAGDGGLLDIQGKIADSGKGNSYTAWRTVTPRHNALVESMLQSKAHIIGCFRSKQEYVQQKDEKTGKTEIKKVGMAPIFRDGCEYEFSCFMDLSLDHNATSSKDRTRLFDGQIFKPSIETGKALIAWLNSGVDTTTAAPPPSAAAAPPPAAAAPQGAVAPPAAGAPPAGAPPQGAKTEEEAFAGPITEPQKKKMLAGFNDLGIKDRETRLSWVRTCLGAKNINSVKDLDKDQAGKVIDALEHALENQRRQKASA